MPLFFVSRGNVQSIQASPAASNVLRPCGLRHFEKIGYSVATRLSVMHQSVSLNVIRTFFVVVATAIGVSISMGESLNLGWLGALCGLGFGLFVVIVDLSLRNFSIRGFSTGTFGLLIGLLCAWLVTRIGFFQSGWIVQFPLAAEIFNLAVYLGFGFIGMMLAIRSKREEFSLLIPYVRFRQDSLQELPILLDSNVIIDGRVPGLCSTGFLGGSLIVPRFVLDELQALGDSSDELKRSRGKRGLECLKRMQANDRLSVEIHEDESSNGDSVDARLIELGSRMGARILTNDANLAKVARLKDVSVLSVNELAMAVKPTVAPGDELDLELVKEGKDEHQAVGYLPDGTMIVVNQGITHLGSTRSVVVAGAVQTSAGRLIFAELKV